MIAWLTVLGIVANALTLYIPKLVAEGIDAYATTGQYSFGLAVWFMAFSIGIMVFTYGQAIVQTYASERVARDMRKQLVAIISHQNFRFISDKNPAKLLTNVTSDIDAIKQFVSQAVVSLISSIVIIIGATVILLLIDWKLALAVLLIIPAIGTTFYIILGRVRKLFTAGRAVIDGMNKVINESIVGAALVRVLDSVTAESAKFTTLNSESRTIGMKILGLFSFMVPTISFISSLGVLTVVVLGGYFVTTGAMTIGSFVAFMSYITILVFPILVLGFISTIIAQATTSYERLYEILSAAPELDAGTVTTALSGALAVSQVSLAYGERTILHDISFTIAAGSRTAIIGPTGSGKTQLLNILTGLTAPVSGTVQYDGMNISDYDRTAFYAQLGIVFQDSVLFNTTVRENITFSTTVTDADLEQAIRAAELGDFIATLPQGLDTVVSERGSSLSGGQKQRIMLARALAQHPTILFLDDFTARVDSVTEQKILQNIATQYPHLTLVSITQKIAPIESYDQIILVEDGEVLALGTHATLLRDSIDYQLIYNSQRSTNTYELRT
jgi:ATP-binding cassette subfamily B protein